MTPPTDVKQIEDALAGLRPALDSDGYDLVLGTVEGDQVEVVLVARPDACEECLVPDEMLVGILSQAITTTCSQVRQVILTKRSSMQDRPADASGDRGPGASS